MIDYKQLLLGDVKDLIMQAAMDLGSSKHDEAIAGLRKAIEKIDKIIDVLVDWRHR